MPGFELEPNDRKVDATAVPMGQAVSGFLSHASDVDWYRYELPLPPGQVPAAAPAEFDAGEADGGEAVDAGTALDAGVAPDAGKPRSRGCRCASTSRAWRGCSSTCRC